MPAKKLSPCKKLGCPELSIDTYCDGHKKENERYRDSKRLTSAERGYDSKWRKARSGYLKKYPLCLKCYQEKENKDKFTPATVVDHIIPHKGDKELFWDKRNWQPLCKRCHDIKTATEDGGFGNKRK